MPELRKLTARIAASHLHLAVWLGALSALGFEPLSAWPLTLIALSGLIELVARARNIKRAFLIGWLFGLAHFAVSHNWVATAFTYQAEMPVWLGAIAVVLLAAYLALFPALATAGAWLFAMRMGGHAPHDARQPVPLFGLAIIPFWVISEWLRAWVLTGYAWNPVGTALLGPYDAQGLAALARWIGIYGVSGLTLAIAALLRRLVRLMMVTHGHQRFALGIGALTALALLAAIMTAPATYLTRIEGARPFTLVQPDLRQEMLDRPALYERNFQELAKRTLPENPGERRMVFWPESGVADYLREGYPHYLYRMNTYAADPAVARARIGRIIGSQSVLLTGAVDLVIKDGDDVAARNSVTAIDGRGHILAGYSKAHLVPFGEYLPLRPALEPIGLSRLVAGSLDFWPGLGPRTLDFGPWGKAGVQICYEIVFSGEVVDPRNRPDFIFNPSNDGWFGGWGPPQHLDQARLRAIEEGLPVLRATTTGISAVIDANGIVRQHLPRHTAGRLDGHIPPPHEPTLFSRFGNAIPLGIAALVLVLSAVALRRPKG